MGKVRFTGSNGSLQKVSFTKLLRYEFDFPLDGAKYKTDALLDNKPFVIELSSDEQAEELVEKATELGAICELILGDD